LARAHPAEPVGHNFAIYRERHLPVEHLGAGPVRRARAAVHSQVIIAAGVGMVLPGGPAAPPSAQRHPDGVLPGDRHVELRIDLDFAMSTLVCYPTTETATPRFVSRRLPSW
jgi:hypothetical protein